MVSPVHALVRRLFIGASLAGLFLLTPSAPAREGVIETSHALAALHAYQVITKISLAAYGKSDQEKLAAVAQIEDTLERFARQEPAIVAVESTEALADLERRYVRPDLDLSQQLKAFKEKPAPYFVVSPANADVARALDALLDQRAALFGLKDFSSLREWADGSPIRRAYFEILKNPAASRAQLKLIAPQMRLAFINSLHSGFGKALEKIDSVGEAIASSKAIRLPSRAWQRFFEIMLGEYFRSLELEPKLNIISGLIDRPDATTDQARFEIMVMNAGPQFQKLLQVYAREPGFAAELKELFKRLEQSLRPVPWEIAKKIILAQKVPFTWVSIDEKPIGVGTMAQVHRAVIRDQSGVERRVVVRFLKPGIAARIKSDNHAFNRVAGLVDADPILRQENFPLMRPLMNEIEAMAMRETDVPLTASNQLRAIELYARDVSLASHGLDGMIRFRAPGIIMEATSGDFMVQEFVPGTSFEKLAESDPALARAAVEELARLWLEHALITSGFFHSDLHQGNLRVRREGKDLVVTLLDYGMTGQMTPVTQSQFIAYGLAMNSGDADLMSRVLWELSLKSENRITQAELTQVLAKEMARQNAEGLTQRAFYEWAAVAMNAGLSFPAEFTAINRGVVLLFRMLEDAKSKLGLSSLMKGLMAKHPGKVIDVLSSVKSIRKSEWAKLGLLGLTSKNEVSFKRAPTNTGLTCEALFN